ncbi:hypothetical protein OTU49_012140 [Cherax quadricarinatus]|uniref:Uncharacterized protein n=1 Tax=Cherax quadricarinatus TaxID=27406 RepID=A0AAW0W048_CHEQU
MDKLLLVLLILTIFTLSITATVGGHSDGSLMTTATAGGYNYGPIHTATAGGHSYGPPIHKATAGGHKYDIVEHTTWTTQPLAAKLSRQHLMWPICHQLPCETLYGSFTLNIPVIISLTTPNKSNFISNVLSWRPRLVFLDDNNKDQACVDVKVQDGNILLQSKYKCYEQVLESTYIPLALYYENKWLHIKILINNSSSLKIALFSWTQNKDLLTLSKLKILPSRVRVDNVYQFGYSTLVNYTQNTSSSGTNISTSDTSHLGLNTTLPRTTPTTKPTLVKDTLSTMKHLLVMNVCVVAATDVLSVVLLVFVRTVMET